MPIIVSIAYFLGISLAFYAGIANWPWYWIFIGGFVIFIAGIPPRIAFHSEMLRESGSKYLLRLVIISTLGFSILCAVAYVIGWALS